MKSTKNWSKTLLVALFSLALTFVSAGGASAADLFDLQSGPTKQKNTVFVDVGTTLGYLLGDGIGGGAGYERAFGDSFSGLVHLAFGLYDYGNSGFGKQSAFSFQIDAHGRYYIFKTALDKLFVDVGLGYELYKYTYEYDMSAYSGGTYDYGYTQSSLTITPKVGWKFIFGPGFVVEPSLGYTIGIGLGKSDISSYATAHSANGLAYGIGLGWAF